MKTDELIKLYSEYKGRLIRLVDNRNYYFKDTLRKDAQKYLKNRKRFAGLKDKEIRAIEKRLEYKFPKDFRVYLSEFGANCGELFSLGYDIDPNKIVKYQKWGRRLLKENKIKNFLDDDTIIFEFHQGYAFGCFKPNKRGKVKIYYYVEGDKKLTKWFKNFRAMLENEVMKLEQNHKESSQSNGHFITIKDGYVMRQFGAQNDNLIPKEIGDRFIDDVKT